MPLPKSAPPVEAIAWCESQWGHPDEVALPLSDRGLALGDGVFETVLIRQGTPQLLREHLQRWLMSAKLLELPPPPGEAAVQAWLSEAIARSGIKDGALRINWSRGSSNRGLIPPRTPIGRCWGTFHMHHPRFQPTKVIISKQVRRWSDDPLASCKSLNYGAQVLARSEALRQGADDALLLNTEGELCCGSSANLLVQRSGQWLTPPIRSGCLPGVMRAQGLELNVIKEEALSSSLREDEPAVLLNSLDCRPLNNQAKLLSRRLFEQLLRSA
ncbi:MAG: hypothetical protein CBB79_06670 [Synechococcus sp. TMED19]|nr:MAG: hypothetical protein CBB79_06670 [Synechococcus sp. TMED19]